MLKPLSYVGAVSLAVGSFFYAASVFAAPTISELSPTTATTNVPVTFTASVNSGVPIQYCHLYVDLEDVGEMTVSNGTANRAYTFTAGGSRVAFAFCRDTNGGMAAGPNTAIWVEGAIVNQGPLTGTTPPVQTPTPTLYTAPVVTQSTSVAAARTLVKLICPANAGLDDPCKAVYYVGADGKRHAFPNSKTYFTWYKDFSGVTELSANDMATIPLGRNVTYRPGTRMIKFATDNKVYAVGAGGTLRWVKTEAVAIALFGTDWNKKIDDIAESFYMNYTFGADINAASDYNPTTELSGAPTFD